MSREPHSNHEHLRDFRYKTWIPPHPPSWGVVCFHGNGNDLDIISYSVVMLFSLLHSQIFGGEQEKALLPFLGLLQKISKGFEKEAQAFTLQSRLFGMRRIHKWVAVLSLVTEAGSEANVP